MTTHFPHGVTNINATDIFGDLTILDRAQTFEWFDDFLAIDADIWDTRIDGGLVFAIVNAPAFAGCVGLTSSITDGNWAQIDGIEDALTLQVKMKWSVSVGLHAGNYDNLQAFMGVNEAGQDIYGTGELTGIGFGIDPGGSVSFRAYESDAVINEAADIIDLSTLELHNRTALQYEYDPSTLKATYGINGVVQGVLDIDPLFLNHFALTQVAAVKNVGGVATATLEIDYLQAIVERDATVVSP